MPDYTYLRQGNEPQTDAEKNSAFLALYEKELPSVKDYLITVVKKQIEDEVTNYYRRGRDNPRIKKPFLSGSYKYCGELIGTGGNISPSGIHDSLSSRKLLVHGLSSPAFSQSISFLSKDHVSEFLNDVNARLARSAISLSPIYDDQRYKRRAILVTFLIRADLGAL